MNTPKRWHEQARRWNQQKLHEVLNCFLQGWGKAPRETSCLVPRGRSGLCRRDQV